MIFLAAVLVLAAPVSNQIPAQKVAPLPSMEEVRRAMFDDVRELQSYSDEWELVAEEPGAEAQIVFQRKIHRDRFRFGVTIQGERLIEQGYDGKTAWVIDFKGKRYASESAPNVAFSDRSILEPGGTPEGEFLFAVSGPYDFKIAANPDLKTIASEEVTLDGVKRRKITAEAVKSTGKLTVELWFDTDRWRLHRARAFGGRTGQEQGAILRARRVNLTETISDDSFKLNPDSVKEFTKVPLNDIGIGNLATHQVAPLRP